MRIGGKVVMVAGGNGALGQAVVPTLAEAGARPVVVARNPPAASAVGWLTLQADLTDEVQVRQMVEDAIRQTGRIDALINLVGGFARGRVTETDLSLWQRMLAMNLTPAVLLSI